MADLEAVLADVSDPDRDARSSNLLNIAINVSQRQIDKLHQELFLQFD